MRSPPLTPIDTHSPALSYRSHTRKRSSFSSNHDRSPETPRSKRRFSNASRYSGELRTPVEESGATGMGMGNLADELDQLDDDDEYDDVLHEEIGDGSQAPQEVTRDSGIDVSYMESNGMSALTKESPKTKHTMEEQLPPSLEDAIDDITRLCSGSDMKEQTVPNFIARLQDLGNQSVIESGIQRLNTSINSMGSHLTKETKTMQTLSTSMLPTFGVHSILDAEALEEAMPLVDELMGDLPLPDTAPSDHLQKLSHETDNLVSTLASLLDTLQMGKQASNTASRHLRTTQTIVAELRRERERADDARHALSASGVESRIQAKWAAQQCNDVLSGFSTVCDSLQRDLIEGPQVGA